MSHCMRYVLGLAAGGLILVAASAQPVSAAPPGVPSVQVRPNPVLPTRPAIDPHSRWTPPIGWDWWRTYPYSPYNAWQNPYWYPPYNNNYPFPPDGGYPYPLPRPYPVPQPLPVPSPWGIGSAPR